MTTISIALATFNGECYLPELLTSLANQTSLPFELVIGDDGSTDSTCQIIRDFTATAPFPVYLTINNSNLGFANNFLKIAERCNGEVIAFCDQDDIWHPDKLQKVAAAFGEDPDAVLVCHYASVVDANGQHLRRRFPREQLLPLYRPPDLPLAHFPGFSMSIKSRLVNMTSSALRPLDANVSGGQLAHDAWIWLIASCVGDVVIISDELVAYRQHQNISGDGHVGRIGKLRRMLVTGTAAYREHQQSALGLACYLETIADEWLDNGCVRLTEVALERAALCRTIARKVELRGQIYSAPSRRQSLANWARVYRTGSAESHGSRFSQWKDLAVAVGPRRGN